VGADLPTPDFVETTGEGGTGVNYGTNSGLVALVKDTTALSCGFDAGACSSSTILDFVGYGAGDTVRPPTTYETAPAPRPASASQAVLRKSGGCIDTNDNSADFEILTPSARNSASPVNDCTSPVDAGSDAMDDVAVDAGGDSAMAADTADTAPIDSGADTTVAVDATDSSVVDSGDDTSAVDSSVEDTTAPVDSAVADTGTPEVDTGTAPTDEVLEDDGCNCRVPGPRESRNTATALGFAALLGLFARARRRR
jgi:MYXO-CTERM domain-containing protein